MGIALRPATLDDAPFLRELRNDPDVRAQSWHTGLVSADEHLEWLEATLANSERRLYVVVNQLPVGQLRLDRHTPRTAELSISLLPEHRRKGYGTLAIRLGCVAARDDLAVSMVDAEIKPTNLASLAAFARADFAESARSETIVLMTRPV